MDDEELARALAQKELELAALREQYEKIGEQILIESAQLGDLLDEQCRRRMAAGIEAGKGLDWECLLQEGGGLERYKACNKALAEIGLMSSGYFPETNQRCVRICMHQEKAGEVEQVATSLELLMPYLKPIEGWLRVSIFERSLFSSGSFKLLMKPDGTEFQCVRGRYSQTAVEKTSSSLREVLAYIQQRHYYE